MATGNDPSESTSAASVPNGPADGALFGGIMMDGPVTVTLDADITVSGLTM